MASRTTLNARNLETLGAPALASLLIEISTGNAAAKRRLRLALAGGQGPAEAAAEIARRMITIARARTRVSWKRRRALIRDLETQMRSILHEVAPADAPLALDLLWRFMALANPVLDRCDDSGGTVVAIFHDACARLAEVAQAAAIIPATLAEQVMDAVTDNGHGQFDPLIAAIAPVLGAEGLAHLKLLVDRLDAAPFPVPPRAEWERVGIGIGGPIHAHELAERQRIATVASALRQIADAAGDPDGYIAALSPEARRLPRVSADIALRLTAAGRADEALACLDAARIQGTAPLDWLDARIAALDASGRGEEAQAMRWQCFAGMLSARHLRDHLRRLPDFEDMDTLDRAISLAAAYPDATGALGFFLHWPDLPRAATTIQERHGELDGDRYEVLTAAAEALSDDHPLAASLALRAMIAFVLTKGRSSRYGHAARHMATCDALALRAFGPDQGDIEDHALWRRRMATDHARKTSFWVKVARETR